MVDIEEILLDENKYREAFKEVTKKRIENAAKELQKEYTDLDELD